MSSHHIIREDQEPALIVDDIDAVPAVYLGQLLEWSPMVLASDTSLQPLQESGIKVDVWFTHAEAADSPQDHVSVKPMGEASFVETALNDLVERGQKAVTIISNDRSIRAILPKYANRINPVLLGNGQRIVVVKSGFSKWKPQGETVWLYGVMSNIVTQGLIHNGDNEYLTQCDGLYSIAFTGPYGLVGERL